MNGERRPTGGVSAVSLCLREARPTASEHIFVATLNLRMHQDFTASSVGGDEQASAHCFARNSSISARRDQTAGLGRLAGAGASRPVAEVARQPKRRALGAEGTCPEIRQQEGAPEQRSASCDSLRGKHSAEKRPPRLGPTPLQCRSSSAGRGRLLRHRRSHKRPSWFGGSSSGNPAAEQRRC